MVLKQVKQLNTFDAIHLYHDAFGKQMLRNVKGRWRASKKSTKHRGDAPTNLTHALHLTLVGKTSFLYTVLAVYTVQPVQRNDFFVEPEWIGSLGSPNLGSAAGLPGRIQNPT